MLNILVSGASGIVGYGILSSLRIGVSNIRLIGTTIYDDSPALLFCDIFEKSISRESDMLLLIFILLITPLLLIIFTESSQLELFE